MGRKAKQRVAYMRYKTAFNYWTCRAIMMEASCIKWEGIPRYLDTVYLEQILVKSGSAIIVYDDITNRFYIGQNASTGMLDADGIPMDRRIVLRNGQEMNSDIDNSVIIYNNSMRMSDLWVINYVAKRMCNIDGAIDVNLNSQKTMPIIPTTDKQALTIENIYDNIEWNIPYVLVDGDSLDVSNLRNYLLFDNAKSFTSDKMIGVQRDIWNRFLVYCGINANQLEKKERLTSSESTIQVEEVLMMKRNRINCREIAGDTMKKVFGWNVKPHYFGGGDSVGNIYNLGGDDMQADIHAKARDTESA